VIRIALTFNGRVQTAAVGAILVPIQTAQYVVSRS
jgi:hypothetical protein